MPAVSTNTIGPSRVSTRVSIASRVVPAMSWTTERSSPTSRLNSVLLPTLGRPTIATRGGATSSAFQSGSPSASTSGSIGSTGSSSRTVGMRATTSSSRSPARRPCSALTGMRVAEAERQELPTIRSRAGRCRPCWRRRGSAPSPGGASWRSTVVVVGDARRDASTTNSTRSAWRTAASTWRLHLLVERRCRRATTRRCRRG